MRQIKIAVIGDGVVGREVARQLNRQGAEIVIFSKPNDPNIASTAALATASTKGANWPRTPLFKLKVLANQTYLTWLKQLELQSKQEIAHVKGGTEVFPTSQKFKDSFERAKHKSFVGLDRLQIITKSQNDLLSAPDCTLVSYPSDIAACAVDIMSALNKINSQNLKKIEEAVLAIKKTNDGKYSVHCGPCEVDGFDFVVISAGASLPTLLNPAIAQKAGLTTVPGYSLVSEEHQASSLYFMEQKKTLTVFKNRLSFSSNVDVTSSETAVKKSLINDFESLIRNFRYKVTLTEEKAKIRRGLRLRTRDRQPLIGPLDHDKNVGIILCGAFYKSGYHMAYEAGRIVLKYIYDQSISTDERAFKIQRFGLE